MTPVYIFGGSYRQTPFCLFGDLTILNGKFLLIGRKLDSLEVLSLRNLTIKISFNFFPQTPLVTKLLRGAILHPDMIIQLRKL